MINFRKEGEEIKQGINITYIPKNSIGIHFRVRSNYWAYRYRFYLYPKHLFWKMKVKEI